MDCVFCKIIKKELPSKIVFEDDEMIAFDDISPKASAHILIVPKKHIESIAKSSKDDQELFGKLIFGAKLIAEEQGIDQSGYKIIINTGENGGQLVEHVHIHLLGGEKISGIV